MSLKEVNIFGIDADKADPDYPSPMAKFVV